MIEQEFQKWFEEQQKLGLIDLKMSIIPGKGVNREKIQQEILNAEAAIQAGKLRSPLGCDVFCDDDEIPEVLTVINRSRL